MKKDKTLLSYILGGLTIILFLPIIESISDIIVSWLEYLKIPPAKKTIKGNKELKDLHSQQEEINTTVMGFEVPKEEEFEFVYEDDFDDRKKGKLGF